MHSPRIFQPGKKRIRWISDPNRRKRNSPLIPPDQPKNNLAPDAGFAFICLSIWDRAFSCKRARPLQLIFGCIQSLKPFQIVTA